MGERIIQIIPAPPNLWARWESMVEGEEAKYSQVVCLALVDDGEGTFVSPMVAFEDCGEIEDVRYISNFDRIVFSENPYKE